MTRPYPPEKACSDCAIRDTHAKCTACPNDPTRVKPTRKPTIYEVLKEKLGREPSHSELVADVKRILQERYEEQCERHPRTREIPLSRYVARNTRDAIRNAKPA